MLFTSIRFGSSLALPFGKSKMPPMTRLKRLLGLIGNSLPPHSFWYGRQTPILVIDEANELNALAKDPDSQDALTNILKRLVMNMKEAKRFDSLLISSDRFFHLWVSNFISASQLVNYIIVDLTKEDAGGREIVTPIS